DFDRQDRLSAAQSDALMDFSFTEEQKALRDSIVKFANAELNHDVVERDRTEAFARDAWRKCAEIGIQGMPVPEEYGGSGLDPLSCAIGLEALGYGCRHRGLGFSPRAVVLGLPRRRTRLFAVRASARLRGPRLETRQRRPEESLPARTVRWNADRRPCDHRAQLGFRYVRDALARRARRQWVAVERH